MNFSLKNLHLISFYQLGDSNRNEQVDEESRSLSENENKNGNRCDCNPFI